MNTSQSVNPDPLPGAERAEDAARGEGQPPRRITLPPPEWAARETPGSAASIALQRQERDLPVARRTGPRAELATLRARVNACNASSDEEGERVAATELARALVLRGAELDAAIKYARRALLLGDDRELREDLSGWFAGIGEPSLAAATLRPLAAEATGREAAQIWTRSAVLLARAGDAAGAADALSEAASADPRDAIPCELLASIAAWAEDAVSAEHAAEGYLEAFARRDARGERAFAFEHLLRAFEVAPHWAPVAQALCLALRTRGRADAADEVSRRHANMMKVGAAGLHMARMRGAFQENDIARALGAAFDARLDVELDAAEVLPALEALFDGAERTSPAAQAIGIDHVLERANLHEVLAARLELACDALSAPLRARARLLLGRIYAGPLASAERAVEAWIEAVALDPSNEEAKAALRGHAASTRDQTPIVEALIRVGEAEETGALGERVACLRELLVLAEQRLGDPGLALWAVRTIFRLTNEDEELGLAARRLAPRARLQDEALSDARAVLEGAKGRERVEPLRRAASILRGRPDRLDEYLAVLRELVQLVPEERIWPHTLERILSRHRRWQELLSALGEWSERAPSAGERDRIRLSISVVKRRLGDAAAALDEICPLLEAQAPPAAAFSAVLVLAARLGNDDARARALLRIAAPLAPALRATLTSVAAELLLTAGAVDAAQAAADQACRADPSLARPCAVRAEVALARPDPSNAQVLERAMGVVVPRAALCRALALAYEESGDPTLALAWTQRELMLCPASPVLARRLVDCIVATRDAARIGDTLAWLLSQSQPLREVAVPIVSALRSLAELDPNRAAALSRRTLDVLGPRIDEVREGLSEIASSLGERGLSIAVLERWLATGAPGSVRAELLIDLAARRTAFGDPDGALRDLHRAVLEGADPRSIIGALERAAPPHSSDGELSLLEARSEALSLANAIDRGHVDGAEVARSFRELGAARWDFAQDPQGAIAAWERALPFDKERGIQRFATDLVSFAGHDVALARLRDLAGRSREAAEAAAILAMAATVAFQGGKQRDALEIAAHALDLDPRRADVLAVAERTARAEDAPQLDRIYQRLADAALGSYGERAVHYRAARQLERRGALDRALAHAIRAFEAVPTEGVAYVLMARLAERAGQSAEVVQALERVAVRSDHSEARSAWLRRAALFAGTSEEGRQLRVEVLLRALAVRADVETMRALGEAFRVLVDAQPEDKDMLEMRFARALESLLPSTDGKDGARVAVEAAHVALSAFDSAELAIKCLQRAMTADGSVDDFANLLPYVPRLANAPESARAFVARAANMAEKPVSGLGRALFELGASLASEFDDETSRAQLLVSAARKDPEDRELVQRAELAAQRLGDSELTAQVLEAVPPRQRRSRLLELARAAAGRGDLIEASESLVHALAVEGMESDEHEEIVQELGDVYARGGRREDHERLLASEAARSDLSPSLRVKKVRDLAALVAARGQPQRALDLLWDLARERTDDEALMSDLVGLTRQAGDKSRQAEALGRWVDLLSEPLAKAAGLHELALLLEDLGERAAAQLRWAELAKLDPAHAAALAALEREAESRGDYETLVAVLGRRAAQVSQVDDVRRIRLRRATVLEQRLGRPDEARRELEALLATTGDSLSVLRVLADLNERLGTPLGAAPLWLRASAVARDRSEAADLSRRACRAYLEGGDIDAARRVFEAMQTWAHSPELLELKVEVERRGGNALELGEALEDLALSQGEAHENSAALLCEAARVALSAGDEAVALGRAQRAARFSPGLAQAQLLARWLEYLSRRGPGTVEQARTSVAELRGIESELDATEQELCAFLLAEALDLAVGVGAGMRELTRAHADVGPRPLIALATAERLAAGGEPARALPLFDAALAGDLRRMRTQAGVALSAARAAESAGELERALAYLEVAAKDPGRRADALELQAELRDRILPETDPGPRSSDVPKPEPEPPAPDVARPSEPPPSARRYSSQPPRSSDRPAPYSSGAARAAPSVRGERTGSGTEAVSRSPALAFRPASTNEAALLTALAKGSVEAGKELIQQLENRADRTHDLVAACRRMAVLLPGDRWTLDKLYEAALADRNYVYARAIEHVLAAFRPGAVRVEPPPLSEQPEQPEWVRAMLFRDAVDVASEALALVWEGAEHIFRRDHGTYGVTGLERVPYGGPSPLARVYSGAVRTLGLARTPLFQRRSAGSVTVSVALLSPPALILSGDVQKDSPELRFHIGAMLGATLAPYVLLFGSPEAQVRSVLKALALAFGAAEQERRSLASVANLAEVLWESIPARSQRRLRELCDDPELLRYESALWSAKTATRRAGLFVAGDVPVAIRETCADENIPTKALEEQNGLSALCASSPAVADLIRLATSPEYAETRWQSARGTSRHSSGSWSTLPV